MLPVIEDGLDARAMGGENGLIARGQVDTAIRVSRVFVEEKAETTVRPPNPNLRCRPLPPYTQSRYLEPARDAQTY